MSVSTDLSGSIASGAGASRLDRGVTEGVLGHYRRFAYMRFDTPLCERVARPDGLRSDRRRRARPFMTTGESRAGRALHRGARRKPAQRGHPCVLSANAEVGKAEKARARRTPAETAEKSEEFALDIIIGLRPTDFRFMSECSQEAA